MGYPHKAGTVWEPKKGNGAPREVVRVIEDVNNLGRRTPWHIQYRSGGTVRRVGSGRVPDGCVEVEYGSFAAWAGKQVEQ